MTDFNLDAISAEQLANYPLKDLLVFQENLKEVIETKRATEKHSVSNKIQLMAAEYGFEVSDLFPLKGSKEAKVSTVKPKYRNPNNKLQTWTGRGRKPTWVNELLEQGQSLDDVAI
jgi:DNA-binding protein H-NS